MGTGTENQGNRDGRRRGAGTRILNQENGRAGNQGSGDGNIREQGREKSQDNGDREPGERAWENQETGDGKTKRVGTGNPREWGRENNET